MSPHIINILMMNGKAIEIKYLPGDKKIDMNGSAL